MENKTVLKLFAVSQPGIEEITLSELENIGIKGEVVPGGVEFRGGLRELYLSNLCLRTANRVLVRVASFRVKTFAELVKRIARYPWDIYFPYFQKVKIRVTCKKSKLYHSDAVAERVLKGINNRLKHTIEKAKFEDEGTSLIVKIENDFCTVSINSSGKPLYKRGYRVVETQAPLRENLAAAIVLASGWDRKIPLVDPFCGSGTIPIEAAMIAGNIPPGIKRKFAFMKWKNFDETLFYSVKTELESRIKTEIPSIFGFDISENAIRASVENMKFFNLSIKFRKASLPENGLPEIAYVVTNPPYGKRIVADTFSVYRRFGEWLRKSFPAVKVAFLSPDKKLARVTGLKCRKVLTFSNGGIRVSLYRG
ncbi:THUMP domain-containing class I SAM-dependent RNA methyltransferase [Desulfurobacterium atlanticum]|uniref:Putative N6-adenine-specific DNA methylase n=1 Tax=Desulfurobacterium atlanticum TaxID=240169 RepID=A0A238ZSN2_9BACT|nr:THUMP domain-containing protein [Desulfurobacterium atlanticum]SNR85683.1 putative N6-adenine-specific DNA methylase [Desulfurobacterium atlanticum]